MGFNFGFGKKKGNDLPIIDVTEEKLQIEAPKEEDSMKESKQDTPKKGLKELSAKKGLKDGNINVNSNIEIDDDKISDEIIKDKAVLRDEEEREKRTEKIIKESFLKEFLDDDGVTDIGYNGTALFIQHNQKGRYKAENQPTTHQVEKLMKQVAQLCSKEWTTMSPILDTEVMGLRINAIHKAVSPAGCTMALRVSRPRLAITDTSVLANSAVIELLRILMVADENLVISGITGSGKTELQKVLVGFIPDTKKITLIEDTMDSHIKALYPDKDINSWRSLTQETRINKIDFAKLIKAGLRNNPDRLLISEIRGADAYDFLVSALTGHSVLTTIHADGARAIPSRIRNMIGQEYDMNPVLLGHDIVNHLRFGLHMEMVHDEEGIRRHIREIVEYIDYAESGVICNVLYEVVKQYDEATGKYTTLYKIKPVSERTAKALQRKEVYHKLPDPFKIEFHKKNEKNKKGKKEDD